MHASTATVSKMEIAASYQASIAINYNQLAGSDKDCHNTSSIKKVVKMKYLYPMAAIVVLLLPACEVVPPVESKDPVIIWQGADYCARNPESVLCEGRS